MERHFNNDFERFLKENADQYRMYPSENSWKAIYNALHGKRRWIAIFASFLLLIGGLTAILMINDSRGKQPRTAVAKNNNYTSAPSPTETVKNKAADPSVTTTPDAASEAANNTLVKTVPGNPSSIGNSKPVQRNDRRNNKPLRQKISSPSIAAEVPVMVSAPETRTLTSVNIVSPANAVLNEPVINPAVGIPAGEKEIVTKPVNRLTEPASASVPSLSSGKETQGEPATTIMVTAAVNPLLNNVIEAPAVNKTASHSTAAETKKADTSPFTQEAVQNSELLKNITPQKSKIALQIHFTPTVSYRKLTENKSFIKSAALQSGNGPNYAYFVGVNNAVDHKPDMGMELGVNAKMPLTKNLFLRGGIQFNVTRYKIRAYNYFGELATIALNTGYRGDSLSTYSTYSNINGTERDWLQNLYFQVSAPIGIEYRIGGTKNISYGIAGTLQPTYVLTERAYLLSTDFKNYAEVPWLIRRWNVNASLEAFVAYSTGKLKWQVGPQVRRQLSSSFIKAYPVSEFPMDYGLKVGVQLNK
jgi:hypothetical protein